MSRESAPAKAAKPAEVTAKGPVNKTTGGAWFETQYGMVSLTFNAHDSNPVKGELKWERSAPNANWWSGEVVFVNVIGEEDAEFTVRVTDGAPAVVGCDITFVVYDGGEPSLNDSVKISSVTHSTASSCLAHGQIQNLGTVVDGNVQVHFYEDVPTEPVITETPNLVVEEEPEGDTCTTIPDGTLTYTTDHYLDDEPLITGHDEYGYNYQGHQYLGTYANSYLGKDGFPAYFGQEGYLDENPDAEYTWYWPYIDVNLMMKWNDAWISNKDCDGDGKLDRHYGFSTYIGSGAWLTNHQSGEYELDGETCKWNYFVKIVAAPADAYKDDGYWNTTDGDEIGPVIWGAFAIIQQVENDSCAGLHGVQYVSPVGPGFGKF